MRSPLRMHHFSRKCSRTLSEVRISLTSSEKYDFMCEHATQWLVKTDSALMTSWTPLTPLSRRPLGFVSPRLRPDGMFRVLEHIHIEMIPSVSVPLPPSRACACSHALSDPPRPTGVPSTCLKEKRFNSGIGRTLAVIQSDWIFIQQQQVSGLGWIWATLIFHSGTVFSFLLHYQGREWGAGCFSLPWSFINTFEQLELHFKTRLAFHLSIM